MIAQSCGLPGRIVRKIKGLETPPGCARMRTKRAPNLKSGKVLSQTREPVHETPRETRAPHDRCCGHGEAAQARPAAPRSARGNFSWVRCGRDQPAGAGQSVAATKII